MSQENVDKMGAAFDAFNRGDLDGVVTDFAPDFEYIPSGGLPDTDDSYFGTDGFKRFVRWLLAPDKWQSVKRPRRGGGAAVSAYWGGRVWGRWGWCQWGRMARVSRL